MRVDQHSIESPRSTHQPTPTNREPDRLVIDTHSIPEKMIVSIVPNNDGAHFLPAESRFLVDPNEMKKRAKISFLRSIFVDVKTFSSPQLITAKFGRATVEGYCDTTYGTDKNVLVGNVLIGKGGGLSGKYYRRDSSDVHHLLDYDPLGCYGEREAIKEMRILNMLIESGVRVGFFCGYIKLNPVEMKKYVTDMFDQLLEDTPVDLRDRINIDKETTLRNVDKVVRTHQDHLVYSSRLMGTSERVIAFNDIDISVRKKQRILGFFRKGMRILAKELHLSGQSIGQINADTAVDVLERIGHGETLSSQDADLFKLIIETIVHRDLEAITNAGAYGTLGGYSTIGILREFSQQKDMDFSLKHVDYEEAGPGNSYDSPEHIKNVRDYTEELLLKPFSSLIDELTY